MNVLGLSLSKLSGFRMLNLCLVVLKGCHVWLYFGFVVPLHEYKL